MSIVWMREFEKCGSLQRMWREDLNKFWVKAMHFFARYWGCHQLPHRSFFIMGYQFPLCARCTGIFGGIIIASIHVCSNKSHIDYYSFPCMIILLLPLIVDGSVQLATKYESNNTKRVMTGLLFGFCITIIFIKMFLGLS